MVSSNDENRNASLLITHYEAEDVLRKQINKGKEILAQAWGIAYQSQLDDVRRAYDKWSEYNCEFLKQNFSDDSELHNYGGGQRLVVTFVSSRGYTLLENAKSLQNDIQGKVDRLDSLLGRLELIPYSAAASANKNALPSNASSGNSVFIVHGHDDGAKHSVARMIERLGLDSIILDEQPQSGRTIIEKFEEHASEVGFAIVLLTPDDVGAKAGDEENLKPRARQNVIFELGFFVGKLGRGKVCALYKHGVEIPSDYRGVGYVEMDEYGGWRLKVADELQRAGFAVNLNNLISNNAVDG